MYTNICDLSTLDSLSPFSLQKPLSSNTIPLPPYAPCWLTSLLPSDSAEGNSKIQEWFVCGGQDRNRVDAGQRKGM